MACRSKKIMRPRRMSVGGILTSAASGAAGGSALGPVGTVAGGLLGLTTGVLGHINEMDQVKAQEELLQKQKMLQRQSNFNANLESNPANIPLLPLGGLIPYDNETVELEQGEPFMTPDGEINSISNNAPTHQQGGVPITLPSGTKVLGKKPAMDEKTFKELGKKLEKQQKKYQDILSNNPSRIEEETATRMLNKVNKEFNDLFVLQDEDVQGSDMFAKGGKVKYPDGGKVPSDSTAVTTQRGVSVPYYRNLTPTSFKHQALRKGLLKPGYDTLSVEQMNEQIRNAYGIQEGFAAPYRVLEDNKGNIVYQRDFGRNAGEFYSPEGTGEITGVYNEPREGFAKGGKVRKGQDGLLVGQNLKDFQKFAGLNVDGIWGPKTQEAYDVLGGQWSRMQQGLPAVENIGPGLIESNLTETLPESTLSSIYYNEDNNDRSNINFGNILGTASSLAPVAYNILQGIRGSEQLDSSDYYNPYESQIRSTLRNRRYNIDPQLEANRLAQATYQRALREAAPSQSQYLGGLQAGAISRSRADAEAIARQQNINNQYLAEQARMDAQLGSQRAATKFSVDQFNQRSQAAARNLIGTGLSQFGQFGQTQQLMSNQRMRDTERLNLLPSLVQNFEYVDGKWRF